VPEKSNASAATRIEESKVRNDMATPWGDELQL